MSENRTRTVKQPEAQPEAQPERPHADPERWVKARLLMQGVVEENGKWKAQFQGNDLGEFDSQSAAMKAYRKAAEDHFHEGAVLPSDEEIDKVCATPVAVPRRPPEGRMRQAPVTGRPPASPVTTPPRRK